MLCIKTSTHSIVLNIWFCLIRLTMGTANAPKTHTNYQGAIATKGSSTQWGKSSIWSRASAGLWSKMCTSSMQMDVTFTSKLINGANLIKQQLIKLQYLQRSVGEGATMRRDSTFFVRSQPSYWHATSRPPIYVFLIWVSDTLPPIKG